MEEMRQGRPEVQRSPSPVRQVIQPVESSSLLGKVLVVLLIILSLLLIGGVAAKAIGMFTADAGVNGKKYQALFLTNGQVYFGKLSDVNGSYVTLKDIYYLQVQQTVQPKDPKATTDQQPQVSLAKLGGELHGPEDIMRVSKEQVLFWENLKDDSKVVTAVKDYKNKK